MTTPTGAISLYDVAVELGLSATGLNLNDVRVRELAGKPSGAVSLNDLRGKSSGVDFSLVMSDVGGGVAVGYNSDGSAGSLAPGYYKGYQIGSIYSAGGQVQFQVASGFTFSLLTIGGVAFPASAGGGGTNAYGQLYVWAGDFAAGSYAMRISG